MRLIDASYEIIEQEPNILGVYKQIEKAARTAYKSEDKITEGSAQRMVEALCKSNHGACLEHGTIYLEVPYFLKRKDPSGLNWAFFSSDSLIPRVADGYRNNPYSKVSCNPHKQCDCITTNARVIFENGWEDDLKYMCEPTEFHEKRITVKFMTSIGIVREILRHRHFSFLNESTRYCNYAKGKFNSELTFIKPDTNNWINEDNCYEYLAGLQYAEKCYLKAIDHGVKPEIARDILPLSLKSELIVTGFVSDWIHFFRLRSHIAATGKPHPDIQKLADPLMQEFIDRGYCTYEQIETT